MGNKKLIEVALPLEKINAESAREKSIRFGHPSTLHLWWARRPLASARAVIWSSLVDDPSSHPELFPNEESQRVERERLFKILEDLVLWDNSNDSRVLDAARKEILKSTNGTPPALLDPFAGGGTIPFEAQRLGLKAYAHDLNPVAIMINKAMIEIPPRFDGAPAVNPDAQARLGSHTGNTNTGLAEDLRYYGEHIKREAYRRIGHLYPAAKLPPKRGGGHASVIAWIWARTVKCTNPSCGCNMPLISSFVLSTKKNHEAWVRPIFDKDRFHFEVYEGKYDKAAEFGTKFINEKGKASKGKFSCPLCSTIISSEYADEEANNHRMGVIPVAVVVEHKRDRIFLPIDELENAALMAEVDDYFETNNILDKLPQEKTRGTFASNAQGGYYGFFEFKDYFTKRQQIALTTFCDLIGETMPLIEKNAISAGFSNDHVSLSHGGTGAKAYSEALAVHLAFGISRMVNSNNSLCRWTSNKTQVIPVFSRQALPMVWDYAENNVFNNAAGDFSVALNNISKVIEKYPDTRQTGVAKQHNAQIHPGFSNVMVSTDPPYYDNICYSDLSDFFYVWLRKTLKNVYPDLFGTMLVPKMEELIATPYRHGGDTERAKAFFEDGMLETCKALYSCASEDIPVSIYYAYKQSDTDSDNSTSNSGWETMLSAIVNAGFAITGTWPMRTEMANRAVASGANALASSIVLVCRKRPEDAPQTTRRNLVNILRRELRPALKKLQDSNIAPVDLAQSAIGPGMGVFSRYRRVLEADGSVMTVRSALQLINEEVDLYFNEQVGSMDAASRFCVDLYTQNAYNNIKYGEAEILANAKSTSIPMMASHGVLYAKAGVVHLMERADLPEKVDQGEHNIWMLTQQLTRAMAKGGIEACAQIVYDIFGSNAESAKDLAYRLYTIAERKGWTEEAYAYNALVVAWPDIQSRAAALKAETPEQLTMF